MSILAALAAVGVGLSGTFGVSAVPGNLNYSNTGNIEKGD
jgi:hypothetical protein